MYFLDDADPNWLDKFEDWLDKREIVDFILGYIVKPIATNFFDWVKSLISTNEGPPVTINHGVISASIQSFTTVSANLTAK